MCLSVGPNPNQLSWRLAIQWSFIPLRLWIARACKNFTYSVDENAGQDEVEDVEHRPASELDEKGDVGEGVRAAAVVDVTFLGPERL